MNGKISGIVLDKIEINKRNSHKCIGYSEKSISYKSIADFKKSSKSESNSMSIKSNKIDKLKEIGLSKEKKTKSKVDDNDLVMHDYRDKKNELKKKSIKNYSSSFDSNNDINKNEVIFQISPLQKSFRSVTEKHYLNKKYNINEKIYNIWTKNNSLCCNFSR